MQIPVLVEPIENQGYRATGGPGFEFVAQGATPDERLAGSATSSSAGSKRVRSW